MATITPSLRRTDLATITSNNKNGEKEREGTYPAAMGPIRTARDRAAGANNSRCKTACNCTESVHDWMTPDGGCIPGEDYLKPVVVMSGRAHICRICRYTDIK